MDRSPGFEKLRGMAIDASDLLGSPQLAGVKVNSRGTGKRAGATAAGAAGGGIVGAAIGATRQGKAGREKAEWASASQTPEFGRVGYLAVTANELALIRMKSGLVTMKLDEVLVRLPRSDVRGVELGKGVSTAPLVVTLAHGETWQLEVPAPSKKHAQAVVDALSS
jgi:hypothetical protein